jgi:hypothetical protein
MAPKTASKQLGDLYVNSEATEVSYQDLQCTKKNKTPGFTVQEEDLPLRIAAKWSTISTHTHTQLPNFEIGVFLTLVFLNVDLRLNFHHGTLTQKKNFFKSIFTVHKEKLKPQVLQCSRKTYPKNSRKVEYN